MTIEIVPLEVPVDVADTTEAARLFREFVDLRNQVAREQLAGTIDMSIRYEEAHGKALDSSSERQHRLVAVANGHVLAVGRVDVSLHELHSSAYADLYVHPDHRRLGIGQAMLERVNEVLRLEGRRTTQTWQTHPHVEGPRMTAATGWGSVPMDTDAVRFLRRAGFALEQVDRISSLDITSDAFDVFTQARAAATAKSAGYELRAWSGATPAHELDSLADLHARMSTDIPAGGLDIVPERWTAQRLKDHERSILTLRGQQLLRANAYLAEVPVAFTILTVDPSAHTAFQEDTLVHRDHRGHRLGALVKSENLLQLLRLRPDVTTVVTWNAEENRHMLAVNEQLGFKAVGYEGAWQRRESWEA